MSKHISDTVAQGESKQDNFKPTSGTPASSLCSRASFTPCTSGSASGCVSRLLSLPLPHRQSQHFRLKYLGNLFQTLTAASSFQGISSGCTSASTGIWTFSQTSSHNEDKDHSSNDPACPLSTTTAASHKLIISTHITNKIN